MARLVGDNLSVWGADSRRVYDILATEMTDGSSQAHADLERLREDAQRVLARCVDPHGAPTRNCQLVVGQVQAGKTSNYTLVSALARDSGFQFFVVLAGTKTELMTQTADRLKESLNSLSVDELPGFWVANLDPRNLVSLIGSVTNKLEGLRRSANHMGQAPVLVVLKEKTNLEALQRLLTAVNRSIGLETVPTLFIDDEADEASPDTNARQRGPRPSRIHSLIAEMRDLLPLHTFLAYTATPQANLLMRLEGQLHPDSVTVLRAGQDYVGADILFGNDSGWFATEILDTPPVGNRAPDSLQQALATFLCQVVLIRNYRQLVLDEPLRSSEQPVTATMMINPSSETDEHDVWRDLVDQILDSWSEQLIDPLDFAAQRLIGTWLTPAWTNLRAGLPEEHAAGIPTRISDEDLELFGRLGNLIERRTINYRTKSAGVRLPIQREWSRHVGWILIGGNTLGRGQTLKNLMTTYMPRSAGTGAIDTLQQRARFFGYHHAYLHLLRGWFAPDPLRLYRDAARSEASLMAELETIDRRGLPLVDWERMFLLGQGQLQPTRNNVVPGSARQLTTPEWALQQVFILDPRVNEQNMTTLGSFVEESRDSLKKWEFETRSHLVNMEVDIPMERGLELLIEWRCLDSDADKLDNLKLLLGLMKPLEPHIDVRAFLMDRECSDPLRLSPTAYRSLQNSGQIHVNRARIGNPTAMPHRRVRDDQAVTFQFNVFRVGDTARENTGTSILQSPAPSLVVHLPDHLRQRFLHFDPGA